MASWLGGGFQKAPLKWWMGDFPVSEHQMMKDIILSCLPLSNAILTRSQIPLLNPPCGSVFQNSCGTKMEAGSWYSRPSSNSSLLRGLKQLWTSVLLI